MDFGQLKYFNEDANEKSKKTRIFIGADADCKNASIVKDILQESLKRLCLEADVVTAGSWGYHEIEPVLFIEKPPGAGMLYKLYKPGDAAGLIEDVLTGGKPRPELALSVSGGEEEAGLSRPREVPLVNLQKRIALRNCGMVDPREIVHYVGRGGFRGWAECLQKSPVAVINRLQETGLRGRGGAGFFTADKWKICREAAGAEKYVVCNAVDGDPESNTARLLLEGDPYSVLEGVLIGAYATGAAHCIIAVSAQFSTGISRLRAAIDQANENKLIGKNILDSDFSTDIEVRTVPRSIVMGEETALIRYIEGKQAIPYLRQSYPAEAGINGKPTLINNIETFAVIAAVFNERFPEADLKKGTKVITVLYPGKCKWTLEVPLGTTFRQVLNAADAGEIEAIQFGGPTGSFFGEDDLDTGIEYEDPGRVSAIMGSGILKLYTKGSCAVAAAAENMAFLKSQSCGKCIFCREGTYQAARILQDIVANDGRPGDLGMLSELGECMKAGSVCGFGEAAANSLLSSLRLFGKDYDAHVKQKHCLQRAE